MDAIKRWLGRQLANPQVALLGVLLLTGIIVIFFFGDMLAPFFAAVVIAYLLDGIVLRFQRKNIPRLLAVIIVFIGFLVGIILLSFGLVPSVVNQLQSFVLRDVPKIVRAATTGIEAAEIRYQEFRKTNFPDLFAQKTNNEGNPDGSTNIVATATNETTQSNTDNPIPVPPEATSNVAKNSPRPAEPSSEFLEVQRLTKTLEDEITNLGKTVVTTSINSFKNLVVWIVYLVLVPVLVFFLLKDKERIIAWLIQFLPHDRSLATQIWHDVNIQTSNYIRGKFWEIILVLSLIHI